ncbi:hypothetical protein [Thermopirellula anaerolimosa]
MNTLRSLLWILTAGLLFWFIGLGIVLSVSSVLQALGDVLGGTVVRYVGLGVGILAILDLVMLVIVLALLHVAQSDGDT